MTSIGYCPLRGLTDIKDAGGVVSIGWLCAKDPIPITHHSILEGLVAKGTMDKGKVAIGSDHGGYKYKEKAKALLAEMGFEVEDFGADSEQVCDYAPVGRSVAEAVAQGRCRWGVLVCGTGLGMSYVANRVKGVRAALCYAEEVARLSREHNDANIIVLGERSMPWDGAAKAIRAFFSTDFSGEERHVRRIGLIDG